MKEPRKSLRFAGFWLSMDSLFRHEMGRFAMLTVP